MNSSVSVRDRADLVSAQARDRCEPMLRQAVESLPAPLRLMAGYQFGWWDATGVPGRAAAGKALRPALVFAGASACGGDPATAVPAAVAVELVHNFTLVHDDVMDADPTRRGRATIWRLWGVGDAILVGDALHAVAIQILTGLPAMLSPKAVARLGMTVFELCRGQQLDCAFETRSQVTVDEYVGYGAGEDGGADGVRVRARRVVRRCRCRCCCGAGQIRPCARDSVSVRRRCARDLGRSPIVAALASEEPAGQELARMYRITTPMSAEQVVRATALEEAAGGRRWAHEQADSRVRAALAALPDTIVTADLDALACSVLRRSR